MVIKDELAGIIKRFNAHGNDNSIFEAHTIVKHYLNLTPLDLILMGNEEIDTEKLQYIESAVERRLKNEPLQYILKSQEFMGMDFYVDENVLIPRADTETLVEWVLKHFQNKALSGLDICSGSGCISLSIAHFNPKALMRGIDISQEAIDVSKMNAQKYNLTERVSFECADIFSYNAYGKYDLIVSNPPYIETSQISELEETVKDFEPVIALDGGEDGLRFYRHIIKISTKLLKSDGLLAFEVGYNQAEVVSKMLEENFYNIAVEKDLCGVNRVVSGQLNN